MAPRKTKRTKRKKISSNENSESSENDNNINSINKSNNENSNNDDSHDMSKKVQKMQTLTITDGQTMELPKTSSPLHNHSNRSTEHANNFTLSHPFEALVENIVKSQQATINALNETITEKRQYIKNF